MDRQEVIESFFNELKANTSDIKSEVLINQALHHSLLKDDIVTLNDGHFYREYRSDIFGIDKIEDNWRHQLIQLHLSRPGIYDLLPEGVFHQPALNLKPLTTAAEMAAASKIDRKKEQAARKFFQPVENGFFQQRVEIEKNEDKLLSGIEHGLLNDYFFEFWGFPKTLDHDAALLLMLLLPYAHVIAGNVKLMEECIALLLNEKVSLKLTEPGMSYAQEANEGLSNFQLGNNMTCGDSFFEDYTNLQYTIGPLQNTKPSSYVTGGNNDVLLEVFNNFFAPADADITINIEVDASKAIIQLDEVYEPILGYSSTL